MRTAGYIVEGPKGSYCLGKYAEEKDILWLNGPATLFTTRKQAKATIKRSIVYGTKRGYNWPWLLASFVKRVERV